MGSTLHRVGDMGGPPVATFMEEGGHKGSTRSRIGYREFHGRALTGELGENFQAFTMISFLRMTQKQFDGKMINVN